MPELVRLRIGSAVAIQHPEDLHLLKSILQKRGFVADTPDLIRAWGEWSQEVWGVDWSPVPDHSEKAIYTGLMTRLIPDGGAAKSARPTAQVLTDRQDAMLTVIESSIRRRGIAPSVRELGLELGIASPNGVMCHLRALETKGFIRRAGGMSRCVQLNY